MAAPQQSTWSKLWSVLKGKALWLAAAGGLIVAATFLGLATPGAIGACWDAFSAGGPLLGPALKLGALLLGRLLLELSGSFLLTSTCEEVANELRSSMFASLLAADISYFDARETAQLVAELHEGVKEIRDGLRTAVGEGLPAVARVVGGTAALMMASPKLSAVLLAGLTPGFLAAHALGERLRRLVRRSQAAQARTSASAQESLLNIRAVRAMTGEASEAAKYTARLTESSAVSKRIGAEISLFSAGVSLGLSSIAGLVLYAGSYLVAAGDLSRGQLSAFLLQALQLEGALKGVSMVNARVTKASGAVSRVADVLELVPVVNRRGGWRPDRIEGDIVLDQVQFAYPSRPHLPVLRGVSMHIPAGTTVALVGPSGSGKSTLASLLLGFYAPTVPAPSASAGTAAATAAAAAAGAAAGAATPASASTPHGPGMIRVDGTRLDLMDLHYLRSHMAHVPQEPLLFNCSIRDNIAYGKPGATDAEVAAAAAAAQCGDFIAALPAGLDTQVGERGVSLSGGQRQRIAIARALLRDPRILLLDEYSNQLDVESEARVAAALKTLARGRTTIIIAHRMATVKAADVIYVLSHGRVVESGSHAQLMARGGMYAAMVAKQSGGGGSGAGSGDAAAIDAVLDEVAGELEAAAGSRR